MNKQIEEMSRIIGDCKNVHDGICDKYSKCADCKASRCYNAGYRKASKVARDIFAEIEESIFLFSFHCDGDTNYEWGVHDALVWVDEKIAELKKKFTEVQGDGT